MTIGPFQNIEVSAPAPSGAHLQVAGDLDMADADAFGRALEETARAVAPAPLVVDLRELTFIDSHGVRSLLQADEAVSAQGSRLVICLGDGPVRRTLDLVGVTGALQLTTEIPAATD